MTTTKTILTLLTTLALLLHMPVAAQQTEKKMEHPTTNQQAIQAVVTGLFVHTDGRQWQQVQQAFAPEVQLDYTSMAGGKPATLTPQQITDGWQGVMPGFDHTHHALSNFMITVTGNEATVFHYGNAEHYMANAEGGNLWTVVGTYNHHLVKVNGTWQVDQMRFNLKYMTGNNNLPQQAQHKLADVGNE